MASYARLMEKFSDALPVTGKKSNESTGTCAYYTGNNTLYLTHQGNKSYLELIAGHQNGAVENVMGGLKKTLRGNFNPALVQWFTNVRANLPQDGPWPNFFDNFASSFMGIKVILNQDLFLTKGITTSGLHGESRIIRFLAIKFLRLQNADLLDQAFSTKNRGILEQKFKEHFAGKLFFGSSQGACTYCGAYMNRLGIRWKTPQGINKDRDETWLNPFSMTSAASTFQHSVKTIYAPKVAQQQVAWKLETMEEEAPQNLLNFWNMTIQQTQMAEQNARFEAAEGIMELDM